ncbi:hypothetical protein [Clostridium sp. DL1XJH146]
MVKMLDIISFIINEFHDMLMEIFDVIGFNFDDKQLHFIIIGIIGIIMYVIVNQIFKALSKISIEVVSFVYTFTVLVVIVFAIEIEQKITGRGNMDFGDIVAGLWGFIYIFSIYVLIKVAIYLLKKLYKNIKDNKNQKKSGTSFSTKEDA